MQEHLLEMWDIICPIDNLVDTLRDMSETDESFNHQRNSCGAAWQETKERNEVEEA